MKHVGVIDIGKTNAKFAVVDAATMREKAIRTLPNRVVQEGPYPHYDIEGIWQFLCTAITDLNRQYQLDAISVTTHGATAALIDAEGALALPVLDYEYDGPDGERGEYDALSPPFAQSFTPRLPGGLNLGAQLFFQQRNWPQAFAGVAAILTYPQYWSFRLTGVLASERTSLGCHTGLWDFPSERLSPLVERLGILELLPPLRSAFDPLGAVRPDLAAQFGLGSDVQVHCGIHDSNASLLPHVLSSKPPFSVVSTGTWVVVCSPGGTIESLDETRDCLANLDALGRTVPSARFMGGREFSLLTQGVVSEPTPSATEKVINRRIFLLPSVQPGSGPFPNSKAQWTVDESALDGEARFVAVSYYLALMTLECLELTGARGPVMVEGPFARNSAYLDMLGAATGRDVRINDGSATGTSTGAALLALGHECRPKQKFRNHTPAVNARCLEAYARIWRAQANNIGC